MSLRDRIPVEPLDDDRMARVERAVIAGLPARPLRSTPWRAIAPWALAVAAIAVAAGSWRVASRRSDAPVAPLAITASAGGTRVDIGDAVVIAADGAAFTVTRPGGAVDIHLARGRIELDVEPRRGRPPLTVHADDVDVVVVGTRFSVEHGDEVAVAVTEGKVRVERGGESTMVAAGEAWSEPARIAAVAPATTATADPPDVAGTGPATPAGAGTGTDVDVLHGRTPGGPPPVDATPTTGRGSNSGSGTRPRTKKDAADKKAAPVEPLADLRAQIKAQPMAAAVDVGATGAAALDEYQRLASQEKGDKAAQGLYGMARVQHVSLGKTGDALRSTQRYLDRFPRGAETEAVLWLRVRILCLRGFDEKCREAAHTYVSRVGADSTRGSLAERVTVTVTLTP